jgi:hypothetical protein
LTLGSNYALSIGGDVQGEWYRHLDGLDAVGADATISLRHKYGLGAYAPWLRGSLSIGRNAVNDAYRNTTRYHAALTAGKRLSARTNLWGEYSFERRDAKPHGEQYGLSNDAFTVGGHSLALNLEFNFTDRLSFGAGLVARHGDVVATTRPGYGIYAPSRAVAADEAFGPDFYAYRLVGTTYGARVGVHYALGDHNLIGVTFAHYDTRADGGNNYRNSIPEIAWEYRF